MLENMTLKASEL